MSVHDTGDHADVDIWCVDLDVEDALFASHTKILDRSEMDRAQRFRYPRDARRWSLARAALRNVLSEYTQIPPRDIRFDLEANGKPRFASPPAEIHFNLSHSQDMALIGVTTLAPLGVDIERLREIPDAEAIAKRFFTAGEVEAYRALPDEHRVRGFMNCWTRKESIIKATGAGLSMPLDSFEVSLDPRQPARLLKSPPQVGDRCFWSLQHVEAAPHYVGAIAVCCAMAPRIMLRRMN